MNKIGRGNKVGFILSKDGPEGAVFRDFVEYGDRKQWNLLGGRTKDKFLVGIGYDVKRNFELSGGAFIREDLGTGIWAGSSFRF